MLASLQSHIYDCLVPLLLLTMLYLLPSVAHQASIISPHVYPPTITGATFLGADLWAQCNTAFGYLQSTGFCDAGVCTKLPVLVGETGSAMVAATDVQWLQDFAEYLSATVSMGPGWAHNMASCMNIRYSIVGKWQLALLRS